MNCTSKIIAFLQCKVMHHVRIHKRSHVVSLQARIISHSRQSVFVLWLTKTSSILITFHPGNLRSKNLITLNDINVTLNDINITMDKMIKIFHHVVHCLCTILARAI
uniref:Uncharacterized protein n=1 Tax=Arundo donax TaxID=35708 RepID=A0A0A9D6Y8_ARUDO